MGNVSSRQDDSAPVFFRDQRRFAISTVLVTNARGRTLLRITPNGFPAERYAGRKDIGDASPVDFIQDPDTALSGAGPTFLLRLTNDDELNFTFHCTIRQSANSPSPDGPSSPDPNADTTISGLTFISGSTKKEIDQLMTSEFHADPNLQKNANVNVVGDFSCAGASAAQISYGWRWRPPKKAEDGGGGWRTVCSFVEYNQRAHKLDALASFSFYVVNGARPQNSPIQRSPHLEPLSPQRLRVPSAQSIESRMSNVSDSESEQPAPIVVPQSPTVEAIPEHGLGLIPSSLSSIDGGTEKLDLTAVGRPAEDMTTTEDGPLFRATMKSLESKTGTMRSRMKRVLRTAEAAETAQTACNDAIAAFTEALREASMSNANAFRPALDHYFEKIAKEIQAYERQNAYDLRKLIIEPINKLYNYDIKQAESKRRDFEEESKDYYAYVGKYLGQRTESLKEKKRVESDSKYESKRRTFELKRFDYSSFMHDLHGGRKEQEVLSQLTKYANSRAKGYLTTAKRVEEMAPELQALWLEVEQADKEFRMQRTEREEKRRALEKNPRMSMADSETAAQVSSALVARPDLSSSPPGPSMMSPTPAFGSEATLPVRKTSNKFKGIRDLEDRDVPAPGQAQVVPMRKEGLLWSLSRPGVHIDPKGLKTAGWHKYWIVLDQGKLSEYVNWKDKLDLHMDPIDLRLASVREARNSERRFCFEVITPQFIRVYQAPSDEDMKSWINAINNALQGAFEAKATTLPLTRTNADSVTRRDIGAVLTGKSTSLSSHRGTSGSAKTTPHRHATTGDKPAFLREDSNDSNSSELLDRIRNADEGNRLCADCEAEHKVEWVSINLGIVLCIECSGIHRSLGTHISKVRSLTLDTAAFTPDIVDLLLLIGNRVSNMIWEARLDRFLKPAPHSTREQRLQFISSKYVDRAYIEPDTSHSPDDNLLTSIKRNEAQKVLHALALRANPNAQDRSRGTHAIFLALAAADPAMPGGHQHVSSALTGTTVNNSPTRSSTHIRKPFAIAELLLQNGADIPTLPAPFPLSIAAHQYLDFKTEQRNGRLAPSAMMTAGGSPGLSPGRATDRPLSFSQAKPLPSTPMTGPAPGFSGGVGGGVGVVGIQGSRGGIEDRKAAGGLQQKRGWGNSGFVGGVKALGDVGRRS